MGIVGLARTLESSGQAAADEMLSTVYNNFVTGMDENVTRKVDMDITPEAEEKLRKISAAQAERVRTIFGL